MPRVLARIGDVAFDTTRILKCGEDVGDLRNTSNSGKASPKIGSSRISREGIDMSAEPEKLSPIAVCQSLPELPRPLVGRENMLDTIDNLFQEEVELVVVEGEAGIGKTTLLSQYAAAHSDLAAGLFIRPTTRILYDPNTLRFDLANQISVFLRGKEIGSDQECDEAYLNRQILELMRRVRYSGAPFCFVIDGLCELPREIRGSIIDILPIGHRNFRFLASGDQSELLQDIRNVKCKPYPLAAFTPDETERYLSDLGVDRNAAQRIFAICRGLPGYLCAVRRILTGGVDIPTLLNDMPSRLPELFEMEWLPVAKASPGLLQMLAILAHDVRAHTVDQLARMIGVDEASALELLAHVGFLRVDAETKSVQFASDQIGGFVAHRTIRLRDRVVDGVIKDLLSRPDSDEALDYLPGYFSEAARYEDLLRFLSPDHFTKMLTRCQSLGPIQQRIELGVKTAKQLNRDGDLMRFSLQKSALSQVCGVDIWRSEVEALIALGRTDEAVALAQIPMLREDRLRLMAVVARMQVESGTKVKLEVLGQIEQLYSQVDMASLGDRAMDVASDLVYCLPKIAVEMAERTEKRLRNTDSFGKRLAQIAAAAMERKAPGDEDAVLDISSRISDPKTKFLFSVAEMVSKYSAARVIEESQKLERVEDRLLLLRQWTKVNRERADAADVVFAGLELAVKTTEYAPNARVFRELAMPLPYLAREDCEKLISKFDSQRGGLEKHGPTEDFIRLQLILAEAESKWLLTNLTSRLIDTWEYISGIRDLEAKATCLARFLNSLAIIDPSRTLEEKEGLRFVTREDLDKTVRALLGSTADHHSVTQRTAKALMQSEPDMALSIVRSLNTQGRRNSGLLGLVESAVLLPIGKISFAFLASVLDAFSDCRYRDKALVTILEFLFKHRSSIGAKKLEWMTFLDRISGMNDAAARCEACCLGYRVLTSCGGQGAADGGARLLKELRESWDAIDAEWLRVDTGFQIASALAPAETSVAADYFSLADGLRNGIDVADWGSVISYFQSLCLSVRAYSGLLPMRADGPQDLERLSALIDRLPSFGERTVLWVDIAMHCFLNKRSDEAREIVARHVRPSFQALSHRDNSYRSEILAYSGPALYLSHKNTAIGQLNELPQPIRDMAYMGICDFITTKTVPGDPYDAGPRPAFHISYEEAVDICEIASLLDNDGYIYSCVKRVTDSVHRQFKDFTAEQKADLTQRLTSVVSSKLPNPRSIAHEGYVVACKAHLERLLPTKDQHWTPIVDRARAIPNLADQVYVLAEIISLIPPRYAEQRAELIGFTNNLLDSIPSLYDRITHYEWLGSMLGVPEQNLRKELMQKAMKAAWEQDDPRFDELRRELISMAYRIDPELAADLASMSDRDPAREDARRASKRTYEMLKLKSDMIESKEDQTQDGEAYAEAAWRNLGLLNGGRLQAISREKLRGFVELASTFSLGDAYALLSWVVQNEVVAYSRSQQATAFIRPLFESILLGAELCLRMAGRSQNYLRQSKATLSDVSATNIVLGPGERDRAEAFLRDWIDRERPAYLKICDPYFGPDDLWIIRTIVSLLPECRIEVLTSRKHQVRMEVSTPWRDAYSQSWAEMTEQSAPDADIVIVGYGDSGDSPIHDRWVLTEGKGLRLGTSVNSLARSKYSEMSPIESGDVAQLEQLVNSYITRATREFRGTKISYDRFSLAS